jgi:hypothetical protein
MAVKRKESLVMRVSHLKMLNLEAIRVAKMLLLEQGKVRALEDDLEKPLNVHRWRFLEGTNPELAQLLRMNVELRERLMYRIFVLVRVRKEQKDLQGKASLLERRLSFGYTGNINEEFAFLADALKQKVKQLAIMNTAVVGKSQNVTGQKGEVLTMRGIIREEKAEYYDRKKKMDEIRASSALHKNGNKPVMASQNNSVYIGGGFAVAGVIRQDITESVQAPAMSPPPKKTPQSILLGPQIVHPRSASMMQPKLPHGWNPSRGALNPRLPSASQLS